VRRCHAAVVQGFRRLLYRRTGDTLLPGACMLDTTTHVRSTPYLFLPRPPLPRVLSHTPWLLMLPLPPSIVALVTPAPMSSPSCRAAQLSPTLGAEMILCVMSASLVDTSGSPFLAPLLESFNPLISYTVTYEPSMF
jgi:hypothetical protein